MIIILGIVCRLNQKARFRRKYLTPSKKKTLEQLEEKEKAGEQALKRRNIDLEEERKKQAEEARRLKMIEVYSRREGEKSTRYFDDNDDGLPF